jgi:uncharacterized protein (TIGR03083 family)
VHFYFMKPTKPTETVHDFPPLSRALLELLEALDPEDWSKPTACTGWTVKDVTAHLLGGNLGRLGGRFHGPATAEKPQTYEELVETIDRNNHLWVTAAKRISPEILIEFLRLTDARLYEHFCSLSPEAPTEIGVAWAGEAVSANWFDIAREYAEKWLHQQHIREAVGRPLLLERRWLFPVLDTFLRGLPHAYRAVEPGDGACMTVEILGEADGSWTLCRERSQWALYWGRAARADCVVQIDQDVAWRLFTNGIDRQSAVRRATVQGDETLANPLFGMVSIMA